MDFWTNANNMPSEPKKKVTKGATVPRFSGELKALKSFNEKEVTKL